MLTTDPASFQFDLELERGRAVGFCRIPLRDRRRQVVGYALVDEGDFAEVGAFRWYRDSQGYVRRNMTCEGGGQRQVSLHRIVMGLETGDSLKVDHRNHDPLDNRRANLRLCTHAQNHQNRRACGDEGTSSQYRGVYYAPRNCKNRPWAARVYRDGKCNFLGYFATEQEAADAAAAWRRENLPFTTN